MLPYSSKQKTFARRLRREQTDAEKKLWSLLRDRQICRAKFRRQHPIGPFVTDFCCLERKVIIELDGGQHAESVSADTARAQYLAQNGFRVVRFWNNEVLVETDAVAEAIARALRPSPKERGNSERRSVTGSESLIFTSRKPREE